MECQGQDAGSSRSLRGQEEEGLVTQSLVVEDSLDCPPLSGLVNCQSRDAGGQDY